MKKKLLLTKLFILALGFQIKSQVAVTEFINNPATIDADREWVELFNYSPNTVNLKNWVLQDEDTDSTVISTVDLFLASGQYLVLASNKDTLEKEWFAGVPNSNIIGYSNYFLANSTDEIVLKDANNTVVWSLAYANDDVAGYATFLEYNHNFSTPVTTWGSKATPGIVRKGIDAPSGTLGYEDTLDVRGFVSTDGDFGSPLAGNYVALTSTSIDNNNANNSISFYPNPTTGIVNFSKTLEFVTVFDMAGKTVLSTNNVNSINIEGLNSGVYFIRINNTETQKLIKK